MLLDTHIFLWWLFDDPKLPGMIREYLENPDHPAFVSAASVWEIATKHRLGKLPEAVSVVENIPYWIMKSGFQPLPISPEHAQLAGSWNVPHRDPFDRMLAAQSRLENIPLATRDPAMHMFGIDLYGP